MTEPKEPLRQIGVDDIDIDFDDEDEEEPSLYEDLEDDDDVAQAMMRDLMDCFFDAYNAVDDCTVVLDHVMRFAALASQVASYELADHARDMDDSPEEAAVAVIKASHQAFTECLTNAELFAATGRALKEPALKLRLDRKFRRSLL